MAVLTPKGGRLPYHDGSLPEEIRDVFGMSKKALKQAIGAHFEDGRIVIEADGSRLARPDETREGARKTPSGARSYATD